MQSVDPLGITLRASKTQRTGRSESLLVQVSPGGGWGLVWLEFCSMRWWRSLAEIKFVP
jgi:hypothetical protein